MKTVSLIFTIVFLMIVTTSAQAAGRYIRHPAFFNLPEMELRTEAQFGYGDTGDLPFGLLFAFGVRAGRNWTFGPYAQLQTSDREFPSKQKHIYGAGLLAEYDFRLDTIVSPYVGLRVGFLDPTGPTAKTVPYAGGYVGAKYEWTPQVAMTASLTLHWAGDKDDYKAYNYRRTGPSSHKADSYDYTLDIGIRYAF